jgi:hypothetical protein
LGSDTYCHRLFLRFGCRSAFFRVEHGRALLGRGRGAWLQVEEEPGTRSARSPAPGYPAA